jgi:Tannase-like family of unknown function (DUF6351)
MKFSSPIRVASQRALRRPSVAAIVTAAALVACGGNDEQVAVALSVESSDAQWVSGGEALVRASAELAQGRSVKVSVNGTPVAVDWKVDPADSSSRLGVVSGLTVGQNTLAAEVMADSVVLGKTTMQVRNHPRTGPMFSGSHETPFICETQRFRVFAGGPLLGDPLDANCSIATRVDYVYRNATNAFVPLPSMTAVPADAQTTTTSNGRTVPYIVRIETGTVNRAVYQTSVLHNPAAEPEPSPVVKPSGWNGAVVYAFGGGCPGGWYRQGANTEGILEHNVLRHGFAVASSSLNVYGNNCNDVLAAETVAMVRERFSEAYGRPRHVIGWGCSGGSYQQLQTADNYPGLLDGIIPSCSFPEVMFATTQFMTDSNLLGTYFRDVAPGTFTDAQQAAVAGIVTVRTLYNGTNFNGASRINPTANCPAGLPAAQRYNAATNPTGVRCTVYDHTANQLGRDPASGFARRPLDNTGIQYGLEALNAGTITVDQFLDMNERVGGWDADGNRQPARTVADPLALRAAYQRGRLTNGGGGLKTTPVIDYRDYGDDAANGDVHTRYHSFSMRERLVKANGHADNFVMMVEKFGQRAISDLGQRAILEMDKWLTAISADKAAGSAADKVVRNKPASLVEGCNSRDATPVFIAEKMQQTTGQCAALYPAPDGPRGIAGQSVAADIIKCQLKPVVMVDYAASFTPAQETRLRSVFAGGVCNWSVPGVEQQPLAGVWQVY